MANKSFAYYEAQLSAQAKIELVKYRGAMAKVAAEGYKHHPSLRCRMPACLYFELKNLMKVPDDPNFWQLSQLQQLEVVDIRPMKVVEVVDVPAPCTEAENVSDTCK